MRPTDAEARALARRLIAEADIAALAFTHPDSGAPHISRIALGRGPGGLPISLISSLALHHRALTADPRAALLIGEPEPRGDPLNHPRLSLAARAEFVPRDGPEHAKLRGRYLDDHPKAKLYVDFADFGFVRFHPLEADLNGGFGRAYHLAADELIAPSSD